MTPEEVRRLKQLGKDLLNFVVFGYDPKAKEEEQRQMQVGLDGQNDLVAWYLDAIADIVRKSRGEDKHDEQ